LKDYFLQVDLPDANFIGEEQIMVDKTQVNQAFEPATDAFAGLREGGDWLFEIVSNFVDQIFGNIL
jgi:hypothetical protein